MNDLTVILDDGEFDSPDQSGLLTISEDGEVPETRLNSAYVAQALYSQLLLDDILASKERAMVDGMFNGARPFSQASLVKLNQADRTNTSFGQAKAIRERQLSSYYDLMNSTQTLLSVKSKYGEGDNRKGYWEATAAEGISLLLKKGMINSLSGMRTSWFDFQYKNLCNQTTTHGVGFAFLDTPLTYKFRTCGWSNLKMPRMTQATDDAIPYVAITVPVPLSQLYTWYESNDARWNKDLLITLIRSSSCWQNYPNYETNNQWEWYETQLKQNSIYFSSGSQATLVHIYLKEFSGKISHFIIPSLGTYPMEEGGKLDVPDELDGFVYRAVDVYDHINQCLISFTNSIQDGYFHSIRGTGYDIYSQIMNQDRMLCALSDAVMESCGTMFKVTGDRQTDADRLAVARLGPRTVLPAGVEVVQTNIRAFADQILPVLSYYSNQVQNNIGVYQARSIVPQQSEKTKYQIQLESVSEATLSFAAVNQFYLSWGRLLSETVRRIKNPDWCAAMDGYEEISAFKQWLLQRDVPLAFVEEIYEVNPVKAAGLGSPAYRMAQFDSLTSMFPYMSENGKKMLVMDKAAEILGGSMVERYFQVGGNPEPGDDERQAMEENGQVEGGWPPTFLNADNHYIHLKYHFNYADSILKQLESSNGSVDVLVSAHGRLKILIPHIGFHTQAITEDKLRVQEAALARQKYQQLTAEFDRLTNEIKAVVTNDQKQKQAQAQQAQQATIAQITALQKELQATKAKSGEQSGPSKDAEILQQEILKHQIKLKQQEEEFMLAQRHRDQKAKQDIELTDAKASAKLLASSKITK